MLFFDSSECEWADVRLHYAGGGIKKLLGFKFKMAQEKEHRYGEGNMPQGIQSGNIAPTGELKVSKGVLDDLNDESLAAGAGNILGVSGDVVVTFRAKGVRRLRTFTAVGVEVTEFEYAMDQGAKSMEVTLPFLFLELIPG